jgi:ABC-type Zn2+ transport system substrate-binding protein/surface adhesin
LRETSRTALEDVRLNPDVLEGGVAHHDDDHNHTHDDHAHGEHTDDHTHDVHAHIEAAPPTEPSRAVVINVGDHTGALVLSSNEQRSGIEVEIHPVARPEARTHVWVLPREGRDGVVYAAVFPSLESGDYAVLDVDGTIASVVSVPPNQVTHSTWE